MKSEITALVPGLQCVYLSNVLGFLEQGREKKVEKGEVVPVVN
jgi:hypothetical protein